MSDPKKPPVPQAPPPGAVRIPPVRDINPDDFADGVIDIMNDWLVKNGHPPIEDDRPTPPEEPAPKL